EVREARDAVDGYRAVGAARCLRADEQEFVAETRQVPDQVQGAVDDPVDLGQEDFRDDGDAHGPLGENVLSGRVVTARPCGPGRSRCCAGRGPGRGTGSATAG